MPRALGYYLAWMAVLLIAYYALPDWHVMVWAVIGASSATAMVLGVLRNQPRHRLPWLLLIYGVVSFVISDTIYNLLTELTGRGERYQTPSTADTIYLVTFLLLAAGIVGLSRSGSAGRDWAGLLDALIFTMGLAVLAWVYLVRPYVADPELTALQKSIAVAYPLGDVLLIAVVARLLASARRSPAVDWLTAGLLGLLVSDILHGLEQFSLGWSVGHPADLGWIVFYAGLGAAALHPSMVRMTEPQKVVPVRLAARRLIPLAIVSLIAPAILLEESIPGPVTHARGIAVASAVLFLLIFARLALLAGTYRQSLARERALREAGAALLCATSRTDIDVAIRVAIRRLLPAGSPHQVLILTEADLAGLPGLLSEQIGCLLRRRDELGAALAGQVGDFDVVLTCPLSHTDQPGRARMTGMLIVAAPEAVLTESPRSVDVLTSQASLAIQRVSYAAEIRRRSSEEYFRTLVQHAADVILIVDDDGTLRYASPSAKALFGTEPSQGTPVDGLLESDNGASVSAALARVRRDGMHVERAGWRVPRADGVPAQVEISYRDLRRDPSVHGMVITLHDVTEQRRLEQELTHRAFHDGLTGLANRSLFQQQLHQALTRTLPAEQIIGVLFLDLDDFKVINDTLGHTAGDQLLIAVAERLRQSLRPHDTAARLGGDEFAVLVNGAPTVGAVEAIATRISNALAQPLHIDGTEVNGAVSIGVATTDAEATSSGELLRRADLALYAAKKAGKRQWRRYQAVQHAAMLKRLELGNEVERAVTQRSFALRYQPIVRLADAHAVGFEALLRWKHPSRGLLAPPEFIDVAEETGLIVPIGEWMLPVAFYDAAHWQQADPSHEARYLSVNVSARQFRSPDFVQQLYHDLYASQLPPQSVVLEITESLLLPDDDTVWQDLADLHSHGIRIAIDDFGTGYSSLSYLRQAPVDIIKIDRSFISSIATSKQQRVLVEAIIGLADTLGLQVVAEGVERAEERDLLLNMGCEYGQGFLFAKPLTYGEAVAYAADSPRTSQAPIAD